MDDQRVAMSWVAHHAASIVYARPTPGVLEIEPSMAWNPAVLAGACASIWAITSTLTHTHTHVHMHASAGVGVLSDPAAVYHEMHTYLRDSGVDGVKVDCQVGDVCLHNACAGASRQPPMSPAAEVLASLIPQLLTKYRCRLPKPCHAGSCQAGPMGFFQLRCVGRAQPSQTRLASSLVQPCTFGGVERLDHGRCAELATSSAPFCGPAVECFILLMP
eukprot:1150788-Pelagomonas_calceolata.AAC.1